MRVSYWTASNENFKIKNLKICNLADFARRVGIPNIHALIFSARLKQNKELSINGWIIAWSYKSPLDEVLDNLGFAPLKVKKKERTHFKSFPCLDGRKCFN